MSAGQKAAILMFNLPAKCGMALGKEGGGRREGRDGGGEIEGRMRGVRGERGMWGGGGG